MVHPSLSPSTQPLTTQTGTVRLRLHTHAGHSMLVGPFGSLSGAKRMAEDLLAEQPPAIRAARVEHRNKGTWRPAWSWTGGAS